MEEISRNWEPNDPNMTAQAARRQLSFSEISLTTNFPYRKDVGGYPEHILRFCSQGQIRFEEVQDEVRNPMVESIRQEEAQFTRENDLKMSLQHFCNRTHFYKKMEILPPLSYFSVIVPRVEIPIKALDSPKPPEMAETAFLEFFQTLASKLNLDGLMTFRKPGWWVIVSHINRFFKMANFSFWNFEEFSRQFEPSISSLYTKLARGTIREANETLSNRREFDFGEYPHILKTAIFRLRGLSSTSKVSQEPFKTLLTFLSHFLNSVSRYPTNRQPVDRETTRAVYNVSKTAPLLESMVILGFLDDSAKIEILGNSRIDILRAVALGTVEYYAAFPERRLEGSRAQSDLFLLKLLSTRFSKSLPEIEYLLMLKHYCGTKCALEWVKNHSEFENFSQISRKVLNVKISLKLKRVDKGSLQRLTELENCPFYQSKTFETASIFQKNFEEIPEIINISNASRYILLPFNTEPGPNHAQEQPTPQTDTSKLQIFQKVKNHQKIHHRQLFSLPQTSTDHRVSFISAIQRRQGTRKHILFITSKRFKRVANQSKITVLHTKSRKVLSRRLIQHDMILYDINEQKSSSVVFRPDREGLVYSFDQYTTRILGKGGLSFASLFKSVYKLQRWPRYLKGLEERFLAFEGQGRGQQFNVVFGDDGKVRFSFLAEEASGDVLVEKLMERYYCVYLRTARSLWLVDLGHRCCFEVDFEVEVSTGVVLRPGEVGAIKTVEERAEILEIEFEGGLVAQIAVGQLRRAVEPLVAILEEVERTAERDLEEVLRLQEMAEEKIRKVQGLLAKVYSKGRVEGELKMLRKRVKAKING